MISKARLEEILGEFGEEVKRACDVEGDRVYLSKSTLDRLSEIYADKIFKLLEGPQGSI